MDIRMRIRGGKQGEDAIQLVKRRPRAWAQRVEKDEDGRFTGMESDPA
jgi:hypothetical protein